MRERYTPDSEEPNFFATAKEHEAVLRGILVHLKARFGFFPQDLDLDMPIEELLDLCDPRDAYGRFAISAFQVGPQEGSVWQIADDEALIQFGDFAALSGVGGTVIYKVAPDQSIAYKETPTVSMS